MKATFFISANINQAKCILAALEQAIHVAELADKNENKNYADSELERNRETRITLQDNKFPNKDMLVDYEVKIEY